jgi:hypothetical protein
VSFGTASEANGQVDPAHGRVVVLPDARYALKSFAIDAERQNVAAYAVFHGTHTGEGGLCPRPQFQQLLKCRASCRQCCGRYFGFTRRLIGRD